jgi:cystinosin
MRDAI